MVACHIDTGIGVAEHTITTFHICSTGSPSYPTVQLQQHHVALRYEGDFTYSTSQKGFAAADTFPDQATSKVIIAFTPLLAVVRLEEL
jgi:hypothetical protein